ncbi:hypothetical protein MMC22_007915 [Lobaria immixta]|nr:hypothetical protein [Lobaria immixta]
MPLLLGFISNAAATALLYSARTVWGLALSRFLQGLSAAVVYSVGFAILADTVGSKDIGQWIGYVLASVNLGMTVSPTLGGILYEKTGYLSIFIVMFGLIAVDILQRSFMVEKKVAMKWQIAAAAKQQEFLRQYATLQRDPSQHTHGEQANESTPLLQSESVSESECESEETESEDQAEDQRSNHSSSRIADCIDDHIEMLDKGWKTPPLMILLGSPRVLANLYGVWVYVTVLVSFDSALPIFVERTFGWGSTGGGLIFLTITIPIFCAPLAGRLSDLYDSRWISVTGFILAGLFTTLLLLVSHDGTPQVALFCSLLTLFG